MDELSRDFNVYWELHRIRYAELLDQVEKERWFRQMKQEPTKKGNQYLAMSIFLLALIILARVVVG